MKRVSFLPLLPALTDPFPEAMRVERFVPKPQVAFRMKTVLCMSLERPASGWVLDGTPAAALYSQQSSHWPPLSPQFNPT